MLLGLATIALSALVFLGGNIYRTDCQSYAGHSSRSWDMTWWAPIPFLFAPSTDGCETHSLTRIAMSTVGIAKIETSQARSPSSVADVQNDSSVGDRDKYLAGFSAAMTENENFIADHKGEASSLALMMATVSETRDIITQLKALSPPRDARREHDAFIAVWNGSADSESEVISALETGDRPGAEAAWAKVQGFTARYEPTRLALLAKLGIKD